MRSGGREREGKRGRGGGRVVRKLGEKAEGRKGGRRREERERGRRSFEAGGRGWGKIRGSTEKRWTGEEGGGSK